MSTHHRTASGPRRNDSPRSPVNEHVDQPETLYDYPELAPVLSLALDAVVASFYPEKIDAHHRAYLERVTAAATVAIYAPIAAATALTAQGTESSRAARVRALALAAAATAAHVSETAPDWQTRIDTSDAITASDAGMAVSCVGAATDEAAAVDLQVIEAAAAVRATALATCYRFAINVAAAAAEAVLSDGMPG